MDTRVHPPPLFLSGLPESQQSSGSAQLCFSSDEIINVRCVLLLVCIRLLYVCHLRL